MSANMYLVLMLAALLMGSIDGLLIALNRRILHGLRAAIRVTLGVAFIVAVAITSGMGYGRVALMLLGAGAAFSMVFRWWLNAVRKKEPTYINKGNVYDELWLRMGTFGGHYVYIAEGIVALAVATTYTLDTTPLELTP